VRMVLAMDAKRVRVLLAMQFPEAREFASALQEAGHHAEIATSSTEAIARLRHLEFDVVVVHSEQNSDFSMGLQRAAQAARIPHVVFSSNTLETVNQRGFHSDLRPPLTPRMLVTMLWSLVRT
jgi:hypothetical protein